MKLLDIFRRARGIVAVMLLVFILGLSSGYFAGKEKLVELQEVRSSKVADLSRNLEYKIPGYGSLLRTYADWERPKLMGYIFGGKAVKAMFLIFFNNFVVANFTMAVRAAFLVPMLLYPVGRFLQGVTLAQSPVNYRMWGIMLAEFGGYFLTICGTLCLVLWTLFFRKFTFVSRRQAFGSGLKFLGVMYLASAFFLLFGSYVEMMTLLARSIR
jgi:hypothetical protein